MATKTKPCTKAGCGSPAVPGTSRCAAHKATAQRHTDSRRGSSTQRGYGYVHRTRFRLGVLAATPYCVLCGAPATVADHYPLSRKQLLEQGYDADDPAYGRGLCKQCHDTHTAQAQPGHRFYQ